MKFKKINIILTLLAVLLLAVGCLNYKPYTGAAVADDKNETDLVKEIAQIEKELGLSENKTVKATNKKEEKIKIPLKGKADLSKLQKITVKENELVNLNVKIEDPDKDKITYSFTLPLNEQGKWKTNYGDAGEYVVTLTASDGKLTSKKDILLVVTRVNVPPIIKKLPDQTVKEGQTVKLNPQVIDPNGDAVTTKLSGPLSKGGVWTTDHTSAGEYQITVTASDGELESKETLLLTVVDVNVLPKITGLKETTIEEGDKVIVQPTISDLDKDTLKTTITITSTESNQPVRTCTTNSCIWQTDYTSHGTYLVKVVVDDGKDKVTQQTTLIVTDINKAPEIVEIKLG